MTRGAFTFEQIAPVVVALQAAALSVARGAEEGGIPTPAPSNPLWYAVSSIAMVALTGLVAGSLIYWMTHRVRAGTRQRQSTEEQAARRFEESVLRSLDAGLGAMDEGGFAAPVGPVGSMQAPPGLAPSTPAGDLSAGFFRQAAPGEAAPGPQSALSEIVRKLETSGILSAVEGPVALGGDLAPGLCVLLKSGKRALLFPPDTPLSAVLPHQRTSDYLILAQSDGGALVCRSLSEFIADSVFQAR